MKTIQTLTILLLFGLFAEQGVGQNFLDDEQENPIYQLELRLLKGDKSALFEIASYFDSKETRVEYLGYHRLETIESEIAKRIVDENSLFTKEEFKITDSTTTKEFRDFFNQNKDKIIFSELATSFLITPIDQRKVNFEIRAVSQTRKQELQDSYKVLLSPDWVKKTKIKDLIKQKDPVSLLRIASEFFKIRNRFNQYYFQEEEFSNLIQYLTGTEIGVENEEKEISWHLDEDYYPESKLNLLIYFSKYYSYYTWDENKSAFINPNQKIQSLGKEDLLFQLLNNENDSIAIDAFTQLTVCDQTKVTQLANEYQGADIDHNYSLPTFPYKFLKQLVLFTDYCEPNDIDFIGTKDLKNNISLLQSQLSFTERRKLENKLINTLTLDDINAFEYWALIYQESWGLTYSAGRILNIFYSKNWDKLIADNKHLNCYLKKSALFDNLGIIGICNSYLQKFSDSPQSTLTQLEKLQSSDTDIKSQVEKVISGNNNPNSQKTKEIIFWHGNENHEVKDLEKQLKKLIRKAQNSSEKENQISEILSQISYSQIPIALEAIENYSFKIKRNKYSFMESDFGFFRVRNFNKKETRDEFIKLHSQVSEYQLYAFDLDESEIDYKSTGKKLDFDKIYELLKYDVVDAFVGGGGSTQDNEVYALVKLLELTFKTTLGYPKKLCNSNNMYSCNSGNRAKAWMTYLKENKLLKQKHDQPMSFQYK